jgi:uncharacterized cupredoxin-like copper-binding protein
MDAARQPEPVARPVEVSITRLATTVFSVIALMLAFAALAVSAGNDADAKTAIQGGVVAGAVPISLVDIALDPKVVEAGVDGVLQVTNKGAAPHSLAVEGEDLATETLNPGASAQLSLRGLEPGTYQMFCTVSGHKEAGMTGELRIGAANQTGAASPAGHKMTADEMDETMAVRTKAFPAKTQGLGGQPLAPTVLPDGTKQFDLTTKVVDWEVEPGKVVKAMTYNGTVPGPTLKVAVGDKLRVVLRNEMDESTAIHFHGLRTPNAMDGVPDITQAPVKPGESFTYEFTAKGPAVGMYHSHQNAVVQVPNGLAGTILVGDLPLPAGVSLAQEVPMMLNDAGVIGFSLNGKSFPATAPVAVKPGEWMLVHYLNEGVMAHPMHLHGFEQLVIAKDGIPLAQPYAADTINVAPGERYSVLVHADEPGIWAWHCHILPHAEREDGMFGMVTAVVVQ